MTDSLALASAFRQDKPWGHETIFADGTSGYVGKVIHVNQGHSLSLQYHDAKVETMHVMSGVGVVELGPDPAHLEELTVTTGDTIHVPAGVVHRMTAMSDLVFVEASTAAAGWRDDVVRLRDDYGRDGTSAP
jgi:mannose-6-phosphate isomerase-like protein (cupin superfamily)